MVRTDTDVWPKVLARIEKRIGAHKCNLWLKNSTFDSCAASGAGQTCTIGLPNLFIQEWVATNFKLELEEAFASVTGQVTAVRFRIDPALLANSRKQIQDDRKALAKSERAQKRRPSGLKGSYTFSSLVVCPANHLAFQAAQDAVANLGNVYNPLFLYGDVGLGKTHLAQAALKAARAAHGNLRSLYVSCDQFVNQFIVSMKAGNLSQFRARFRRLDLLVIDDIQVLSNKDATQSEFLHTFNELETAGSQIILASDAHPKYLKRLTRSLIDRFVSGMVVKLSPPNQEDRVRILQSKVQALGKTLEPGVIEAIARRASKNVRELEGALTRVIAFEAVSGTRITERLVDEILGNGFTPDAKGVTLQQIEASICSNFRVTTVALKARGRKKSIALPRQIAMYLAREMTDLSLKQIGDYFGNRNHTTVMFACKQIAKVAKEDGQMRRVLSNLKAALLDEI